MSLHRRSGVLAHITSLPGRYGIGDLGKGAYDFIDFLSICKQSIWQFLPLGPVSLAFDNSPYMSLSAFAGNPYLISPDLLLEKGLLNESDLADVPSLSEYYVEFEKVIPYKDKLYRTAYETFAVDGKGFDYEVFCKNNQWLDDFALFMAIKDTNEHKSWVDWPRSIATRDISTINTLKKELHHEIGYYKFLQYCFYDQWFRLRKYASDKGVLLVGDMPIYVGMDSADVWANQNCFKLDAKTLQPTHVAGVPPDYFSETGQRWGNPIYKWRLERGKMNQDLLDWWTARFRHTFDTVDMVRIDHFRGFEAFWEIPAREETAVKGKWVKGPGKKFFQHVLKKLGEAPIIAEDLGVITPQVEKLRDDFGFPGMKILQFAFDSDETNPYLPHNFETSNCVVFTGTHDNDTTVGWYFSNTVSRTSKERALRYANSGGGNSINWDFIRMAFASTAQYAIIPMQDVLGFGGDCRMNRPSTRQGNWRWRCAPRFVNENIRIRLLDETEFYGRAPKNEINKSEAALL